MTYEEVYEYLKIVQETLNKKPISNARAIEINDKAIKAIEKQIPKRPIKHSYQDGLGELQYYYTCPNSCDVYCHVNSNEPFCCKCGQAIDWRILYEEEEKE